MKHFLPVNAGDTERVLELIYVSKGQASRAACLIGALSCAWGWDWDHDHQGKPICQLSLGLPLQKEALWAGRL